MPTISGEGYISKMGHTNFYMFLVIDGQKTRRPTGTSDADEAVEKLNEWKAQAKVGVIGDGDGRMRYEDIRNFYIESGKQPQESVLRDLDKFFWKTIDTKNLVSGYQPQNSVGYKKNTSTLLSAFTTLGSTKIEEFKRWREKLEQVVESKEETFQKEVELRKLKAQNGSRKPFAPAQIKKVEAEAREWVEKGVKATTNRRLTVLRAMFNYAAKHHKIKTTDVPASFHLWEEVDNVKTNKFSEDQFESLLKELPSNLHPALLFQYNTGMRSGQIESLTLDTCFQANSRRTVKRFLCRWWTRKTKRTNGPPPSFA